MPKHTVDLFRLKDALPARVVTDNLDEVMDQIKKEPVEAIGLNRMVISSEADKEKLIEILNQVRFLWGVPQN